MKKRLLSLLLAILMVVTSVPMFTLFAFAEEEKASYDYDSLYVGAEDGGDLFFAIDFFSAKSSDAFTSTTYANTFAKFVTKAEKTVAFSGGTVNKKDAWTYGLSATAYPQYFLINGFGASSFNSSVLIYENEEAAAGVENAIIYDANNEEKFHTKAMESLGAAYAYDFDTYDYYLLDDDLFIYRVDKATKTDRRMFGFSSNYYVNSSGCKRTVTKFGDGYLEVGLGGVLSSDAVKLATDLANNPEGDYTVEIVASSKFEFFSRNNPGVLYSDPAMKISFSTSVSNNPSKPNSFYIYPYFMAVGKDYKEFQGNISTLDIANANTLSLICDVTNNTSEGTTYSGTANMDVFVNNRLVVKGADQWKANYLETAYDTDGNRIHTYADKDISVANTSNFNIGAGWSYCNPTVYAIRVYDRVLTQGEIDQNHFADLAKFYKLDMYDYDSLTETEKANIHASLRSFFITETTDEETAAAVQSAYNTEYLKATATGNEILDTFTARVVNEGFDISALSLLPKTKKEEIITNLSGTDFTQSDIDEAVVNASVRVNTTTQEQYNSVYVPDDLQYHISFIGVKGDGNPISDGTNYGTKAAFAPYVVYQAPGNTMYLAGYASTKTADNTALLQDGYLQLYSISGSTTTYRGLQLSNTAVISDSEELTVQVVTATPTNNKNFSMWFFPQFRLSVSAAGVLSSSGIGRWGYVNYNPYKMSFSVFAAKAGTTTSSTAPVGFSPDVPNTYTVMYERDFSVKSYVYHPKDYNEEGKEIKNSVTSAGKEYNDSVAPDSKYYKSGVISLPTIEGIDGETVMRTSTDHFNGAVVPSKGEMEITAYVNDRVGFTLAKQPYYDSSVYNLSPSSQTGAPLKIYAIRMYLRKLTEDELAQNHFADLVKMNEVDISNIFSLTKVQQQEIYNLFEGIAFDEKTTEELQAMYDEKYNEVYYESLKEEGNYSHNHVVDLAYYYSLDLSLYNALPDSVKAELYKKTDEQDLDESVFNVDMKARFDAWIDDAIENAVSGGEPTPEVDPYDIYVSKGLEYHLSFLRANGNGELLADGSGNYGTIESFAPYVIYQADTNNLAVVASKTTEATAPYVMDGYIKLFDELGDLNGNGKTDYQTEVAYRGLTMSNTQILAKTEKLTMEITVSTPKQHSLILWFMPFTRMTLTTGGKTSISLSRFGRQSWSPYPMTYTTLDPMKDSLTTYTPTGLDVSEAQTFSYVYERDFTKTTYVYDPDDYVETNKLVNEHASGDKKGQHESKYVDSYYTSLNITNLPTLTSEQEQAIIDAGFVVKDGQGNVTALLRNNTELFRGATVPMTGVMAVDGYINADPLFKLASQPFTTTSGVYTLFSNYQQNYGNLYSLRVYSRQLSTAEMEQNRFADLAVKFDLDLDVYAMLSDEEKAELYSEMSSYKVTDAKQTVVDAYEIAIEEIYYSSESETPTENEVHFYEIASYYKLNLTKFNELGRNAQLAVCDEFADVVASESVKATLIMLRLQEAIEMQLGDYYASNLIEFLGYQARTKSYPGIRATFTYNKKELADLEAEGCTVEMGVIMAIASEGRTKDDLYLKRSGGSYVVSGGQMLAQTVYKDGKAVGNIVGMDTATPEFVYSIVYSNANSQTAEMYDANCMYRAYAIVTKDGTDYVTYFDCESGLFGDSISIYELSAYWMYEAGEGFIDTDVIKEVITKAGYTDEVLEYYGYYEDAINSIVVDELDIPRNTLNLIYNVVLRAEKDPTLALKLKYFEEAKSATTANGNFDICAQINTLFDAYNALHGVDIRDELYEIVGDADMLIFDVTTDKAVTEYTVGDSITFNIALRDKTTNNLISCNSVSYSYQIEGCAKKIGTLSAPNGTCSFTIPADEIAASPLADKGLVIKANAEAAGFANQEVFAGGAIVDMDKITVAVEEPEDFEEFWKGQIERLLDVDPTSTVADNTYGTVDGYDAVTISDIKRTENENGYAVYSKTSGKTITEDNYFHAIPVDEARVTYLQSKGLVPSFNTSNLKNYYVYELYLKAPGPNPAVATITIPKYPTANTKIIAAFQGYSASSPGITISSGDIYVVVSHASYWIDASMGDLYQELRDGILNAYGRANGKVNSDFNDANDNYILYMFLRNLQIMRFVTDLPETTEGMADGVLKNIYDQLIYARSFGGGKNVKLSGSSMGGYQTLGLAALINFYNIYNGENEDISLTVCESGVPTFCNFAGPSIDGRFGRTNVDMGYEGNNHDYFDAAFLARYIVAPVTITRCGLGDYTCPPASIIAAYNNLKCEKTMHVYQNSTHGYYFSTKDYPNIPVENYKTTVSEASQLGN